MKTGLLLSFWSLLLAQPLRANENVPPIEKVTVYADRAEVSRATPVVCKDNQATAVFGMLPLSLDQRTLRAETGSKATAIGTTVRTINLAEDRDARVAAVQKELTQVQDQLRALGETQAGISKRVTRVAEFGAYVQNLLHEQVRAPRPDSTQWDRALDTMRGERLDGLKKQGRLNIEQRKLSRQAELLRNRLAALQPRQRNQAIEVTVAIDCRGEARPRVRLSYVLAGATWHPEYDLRFLPRGKAKVGKGRVELTVSAVVQQATGEDWTDAKLVLSTAKPRLGSEAPYPAPMYINGREVGENKTLVAKQERREKLAGPAKPLDAAPASVALEDRGQSFALVLPRKVTVLADGRPYWMPVDVASGKAEAKLVAIAKLKPFVYQMVNLKNPAAYPLLAGRIHVYRGGSYIGDSHIKYRAPGEPMEISLGIDEEFSVERQELNKTNRSASFLSSTKHLERAFRITLANRSTRRQKIEIRENIPVSKTEDVKVELVKKKTAPHYQLDTHRGFITWTPYLDSGQEKSIDLTYTIHLPEDWKVQVR